MKYQPAVSQAFLPHVAWWARKQTAFWRLQAHAQRRKHIGLQSRSRVSVFAMANLGGTYPDADQDHLNVAEHLWNADEDVQQNGHELRETGRVTRQTCQRTQAYVPLPASRKEIQDRLFEVIIHQAACNACSDRRTELASPDSPYSNATTIAEKSSRSTMSAASRATSEPLPIAIPQSAARNAGASLTPSPVTPTTPPRACKERTIRSFCSGVVRAKTTSRYAQRMSSCSDVSVSSSAPVMTMLCGGSCSLGSGVTPASASSFSFSSAGIRSKRSEA